MSESRDGASRPGIGSRFFQGLRNAIVEEDPKARGQQLRAARTAGAASDAPLARSAQPPALPDAAVPASPMTASLLGLVLDKPTAFTALTDKLAPLEGIIADERTRYRAAHALIKTSRSVEQVIAAIDMQHLQWLDAEVTKFAAQLKEKEAAEVQSRLAQADSLRVRIEAANQEVLRLRQEFDARVEAIGQGVQSDRQKVAQLAVEVDARRKELAEVQTQFQLAATAVKDTLAEWRAKVLAHLG